MQPQQRTLEHLPLTAVIPDPDQPRKRFSKRKLRELADSIKSEGVIQPIEVSRLDDGRFLIHHGERRWRAATMAGLDVIPAVVAPSLKANDKLLRGLIENIQREDMNPIDEAKAYKRLRDMGLAVIEIARRTGRSQPLITGRLLWLELDEAIQEYVASGELQKDPRVANALLSVPRKEARLRLAKQFAERGVSINGIENACQRVVDSLNERPSVAKSIALNGRVPSLALSQADTGPADDTAVGWPVVRAAAKVMCDECNLRDLTKGVEEPAWMMVKQAAEATCKSCDIHLTGGNLSVCRECPGVELIARMVEALL